MTIFNVITLDGPVGVGKSSVAAELAARLGYRHVDTGAMYRCVTLAAMREGTPLSDEQALSDLAACCDIRLIYNMDSLTVLLNGEDVSAAIRDPEVSRNTSAVADAIGVRKRLVSLQRDLGLQGPSILEGRDIGTIVFPDAFWKFYLDAALEERTRRRVLQLEAAGKKVDFQDTMEAIRIRDQRDRARPWGPLAVAPDAIVIDTTSLSQNQVVNTILTFIRSGCPNR